MLIRCTTRAARTSFGVSRAGDGDAGQRRLVLLAGRGRPLARPPLSRRRAVSAEPTSTRPSRSSAAATIGWPRAASPTSSWSCRRSSRSIRSTCPRGWPRSAQPSPLRSRASPAMADSGVDVARPAPGAARGEGARARLLPDRFALELSSAPWSATTRSCAKCSARCRPAACRRSRRRSGRPTCRASTSTAAISVQHARPARAHPRGRRRAARQGPRRHRRAAARKRVDDRVAARQSRSTPATAPGCRAPSSIATRWRSR